MDLKEYMIIIPKTKEINFAFANNETKTIFIHTNQICPFLCLSLKKR